MAVTGLSSGAPVGERAFTVAGGDAVTVWNANAGVAATEACLAPLANPLHESRIYAMMHVAIHDALNAIDRRSRPYTFDAQAEAGASPDAAVAAAARDVLVPLIAQLPVQLHTQACIDAGVASVEAAYTTALAAIPAGEAKARGLGPAFHPGEILLEEFLKPLGMMQAAGGQDTGDVDRAPQMSSCG